MANLFNIGYKKIISWSIALILLSIISILFFDREIYFWINLNLHHGHFHSSQLKGKTAFYEFVTAELTLLGFVALLIVMMLHDSKKIPSKFAFLFFVVYQMIFLFIVNITKVYLKFIFARCVPEICFLPDYVSLVNTWGFHWLSFDFASFPSGHSVLMGYCFLWSRVIKSKFSNFVSWIFLAMILGMILFNYHFLGDCLAGTGIGLILGLLGVFLWNKIIIRCTFLN